MGASISTATTTLTSTTTNTTITVFLTTLTTIQLLTPADPIGKTLQFLHDLSRHERRLSTSSDVHSGIDDYVNLHSSETTTHERNSSYRSLVNAYYDLATLFYEWGWGKCFHFAYRHPFESFDESIRRHEYYLVSKLGLLSSKFDDGKAVKVLDVGCGIGGPMRNIAKFLLPNVDITGITLNPYQVQRCNQLCHADTQLHSNNDNDDNGTVCRAVQGDFMSLPFQHDTFDAVYAIEATCHAPDRIKCYQQIYNVLKPGGVFACYEWCLTDLYDKENEDHRKLKKLIEEGDGLPDIISTHACLDALKQVGFEVMDQRDMALDDYHEEKGGKAWYLPLTPSWNPFTQRFQFNWFGMGLTKVVLRLMEPLYLAPKGTVKTQAMLQNAAIGLGNAGKEKIFTPMYLMVGRVPLDKKKETSSSASKQ